MTIKRKKPTERGSRGLNRGQPGLRERRRNALAWHQADPRTKRTPAGYNKKCHSMLAHISKLVKPLAFAHVIYHATTDQGAL